MELDQPGGRVPVAPGATFAFGDRTARAVAIARWGRFTWSRAPALPAVWLGFAVILVGCALLAFPAGVARLREAGEEDAATVFVTRGAEVIAAEWDRAGSPTPPPEA